MCVLLVCLLSGEGRELDTKARGTTGGGMSLGRIWHSLYLVGNREHDTKSNVTGKSDGCYVLGQGTSPYLPRGNVP